MPYKIVSAGTVDREQEECFLNYAFISETDFLLVVALTSCANLVVLYRAGSDLQLRKFSIYKYFQIIDECRPTTVALTPDASVIVVVLTNFDILLIPLKCELKLHWGNASAIARKPSKFSVFNDIKSYTGDENCCPSSAFCFKSILHCTYLVVGDKIGIIVVIDLNTQSINVQLRCPDGVKTMQYYQEELTGLKSIFVTLFNGEQYLFPLETDDTSVCDTVDSANSSDCQCLNSDVFYVLQNISQSSANSYRSLICAIDRTGKATVHWKFSNSPVIASFDCDTSFFSAVIQYTPKVIIAISRQHEIFINFHFLPTNSQSLTPETEKVGASWKKIDLDDPQLEIIDILPLHKDGDLEECLVIAQMGFYWLRPQKNIYMVVADFLSGCNYSVAYFMKIGKRLSMELFSLYENILHTILRLGNSVSNEFLISFLSFGVKINYNIPKLFEIFHKHSESDTELLLPFLLIHCEKRADDYEAQNMLFNGYISQARRLNKLLKEDRNSNSTAKPRSSVDLCIQRDTLEKNLRCFLINFNYQVKPDMLTLLMKNSLWSCVALMLDKDSVVYSPTIVRFLSELAQWDEVKNVDSFLKCLLLLEWSMNESMTRIIVKKLIGLLTSINSTKHLEELYRIADSLLKKPMDIVMVFYLTTSIRLLSCLVGSDNGSPNGTQIACGSNCSAVVLKDSSVSFWGEFSAGTVRIANDARSKLKKVQQSSPQLSPRRMQSSGTNIENSTVETCFAASIPKIVALPVRNNTANNSKSSYKIRSVACGTEHILLLTIDGLLLSWGRNRYGQCGIGNNQPIKEPVLVSNGKNESNFGRVEVIFAGHYHSALINERDEVWMWGWAMYGQLATGDINNRYVPTKIDALCYIGVTTICLAYAHSLFRLRDGTVLGCGATSNGQLGIDPQIVTADNNPRLRHLFHRTTMELKVLGLLKLDFSASVSLISSNYFHGVAICPLSSGCDEGFESSEVGQSNINDAVIYEWGECPHTTRMRSFLSQRLRNRARKDSEQMVDETEHTTGKKFENHNCAMPELKISGIVTSAGIKVDRKRSSQSPSPSPRTNVRVDSNCIHSLSVNEKGNDMRDYFKIRKRCIWSGEPIRQLSVGFNHSAFVTENGDLYTWGKALEMQLGHGDKKDKETPTLVIVPSPHNTIKWAHVECARNFTVAVSIDGCVYVWGRNDKNHLGISNILSNKNAKMRRIVFKPKNNSTVTKVVELPSSDTNVDKITRIYGIEVHVQKYQNPVELERRIYEKLSMSDQCTLNMVSKHLIKKLPVDMKNKSMKSNSTIVGCNTNDYEFSVIFCTAELHILAGDLLNSIDVLSLILERNNFYVDTNCSSVISPKSPRSKEMNETKSTRKKLLPNNKSNHLAPLNSKNKCSPNNSTTTSPCSEGNMNTSNVSISTQKSTLNSAVMERFENMVDRVWNLVRSHPHRDVQTMAVLLMLRASFPIYHRLAADTRLCRLIDGYLNGLVVGISYNSSSSNLVVPGVSMNRHFRTYLSQMGIRERFTYLKRSKVSAFLSIQPQNSRLKALRYKCNQIANSQSNRFRFYSNCTHYERCVVESGATKLQNAALRNRLRKCSHCVMEGQSSTLSSSLPSRK